MNHGWVPVAGAALLTGLSKRTIWRLITDYDLDTGREPGSTATFVHMEDIRRAQRQSATLRAARLTNAGTPGTVRST